MDSKANSESSELLYADYPLTKKISSNGDLNLYKNSDALTQAVKLWLVSGKGERLRSNGGGVLLPHLGKSMDEVRAKSIYNDIYMGIKENFQPAITVVYLNVEPDYVKNRWKISLAGYNEDLNIGLNSEILINNF